MRRWLHEIGWVWKRPKLVAKDNDPHRIARLARIQYRFEQLKLCEAMVFADKLDIHLLPKVGAAWMPKIVFNKIVLSNNIGQNGGMEPRKPYPTDLSDREWALIHHLVPTAKPGGRPEKSLKREIMDAIFYILRGGGAWRLLPHDFPPWQIVYQYFWRWQRDGTWQRMHELLRGDVRVAAGKRRQPSAGILESQSVKTTEQGGSAATTRANRSRGASGISSSIPWG